MPDSPDEVKSAGGRGKTAFAVFSLIFAFGAGFYVSSGISLPGFLKNAGAVVSQTFSNVLGSSSSEEKTFEVDLSSSPQTAMSSGGITSTDENSAATGGAAKPFEIKNKELSEKISAEAKSNLPGPLNNDQSATVSVSSSATDGSPSAPDCGFSSGVTPSHQVILNEIAWTGSPQRKGETAAAASNNEWMELKNLSQSAIDLSGWQILDESEKFNIVLENGKISPNNFYLMERSDDDSVLGIAADKIYSGAISNSGMWLKLLDDRCVLVDELNALSSSTPLTAGGWPGGDNATKQTLERDAAGFSWHTSASAGGTPKKENSVPLVQLAAANDVKYALGVSLQGDGSGSVLSSPTGISCGADCSEDYLSGTVITLTASSSANSSFLGWSGACSGASDCKITMTSTLSVIASFKSLVPLTGSSAPPPPAPPPVAGAGHILISEIMAGLDSDSNYEFVELYNPTQNAMDLTGWSIKKKTSSGTESLLVSASRLQGKSVPPGRYFLIAHDGGYSGSTAPDVLWPASYTLAYTNNAIELFDAGGAKVEEVSWIEIPAGQSYVRQSWDSAQFSVSPNPTPQNSSQ